MLEIFNNLAPFFEDVYREISVREYAREQQISPPTASKLLKKYEKGQPLLSSKKGVYIYYRANRTHAIFQGFARLYWQQKLHRATEALHKEVAYRTIILFGSLAKAENTRDSDVDMFIDIPQRKINGEEIEKKLKRKVQFHFRESMQNLHLKKNIEQGVVIR